MRVRSVAPSSRHSRSTKSRTTASWPTGPVNSVSSLISSNIVSPWPNESFS